MCTCPTCERDLSRSVDEWIRWLDAPLLEDAEDAKWALVNLARGGFDVIDPLASALPRLSVGGQVEALEGFLELETRRVADAVIELLDTSDDGFVRQVCAEYLGGLRIGAAVPALRRAYRNTRERGLDPDWVEPAAILTALTDIGDRVPVLPPAVAAREVTISGLRRPVILLADAVEVLGALAAADQVVLSISVSERRPGGRLSGAFVPAYGDPGLDLDTAPWGETVARASDYARAYVRAVIATGLAAGDEAVFARFDWIDRSDL